MAAGESENGKRIGYDTLASPKAAIGAFEIGNIRVSMSDPTRQDLGGIPLPRPAAPMFQTDSVMCRSRTADARRRDATSVNVRSAEEIGWVVGYVREHHPLPTFSMCAELQTHTHILCNYPCYEEHCRILCRLPKLVLLPSVSFLFVCCF